MEISRAEDLADNPRPEMQCLPAKHQRPPKPQLANRARSQSSCMAGDSKANEALDHQKSVILNLL